MGIILDNNILCIGSHISSIYMLCTHVKSPHKRFAAMTYVWSRDPIGFFLQGKVIREVCWVHPGGMSPNIIEVQCHRLSCTWQQSWQSDFMLPIMLCHAFAHFLLLETPVVVCNNKNASIRVT